MNNSVKFSDICDVTSSVDAVRRLRLKEQRCLFTVPLLNSCSVVKQSNYNRSKHNAVKSLIFVGQVSCSRKRCRPSWVINSCL